MNKTIATIQPTGTFPKKTGGVMYSFRHTFTDTSIGDAAHYSAAFPFTVGQNVEVTVTGDFKGVNKVRLAAANGLSATAAPQPANPAQESLPLDRPGDTSEFHKVMKKMALTYLHAKDYAAQIGKRSPFSTVEQEQACVATLFIESARRNLIDIVPARGVAPAAPAPAAPPPPKAQPSEAQQANLTGADEDVPF